MNIETLRCEEVEITPIATGETLTRFTVRAGYIFIADRGFANCNGVNRVLDRGGDVVLRLELRNLPLMSETGEPFDQLAISVP
ncbi:hypothetical protein IHE33_12555 (plasmid) [Mycetohabitans endofungorum]|uniref:hypothetical protein n=1 Tax=Mycetohabitans endofungorum TaxID=417203 RepID=UPI0030CC97BE